MRAILTALALASLIVLGGCVPQQDPCRNLPPADQAAIGLVNQGIEVERDGENETECELQPDGRWVAEQEESAHVGTTHRTTTKPTSAARATTKSSAPRTSTSRSR